MDTEKQNTFNEIKAKLGDHDQRFDQIDERFTKVDERFDRIDERFDRIDERFTKVDERFDKLEDRMDKTDSFIVESFNAVYAKFEESKEENRRHFAILLENVQDQFRPFREKGAEHDDRLADHEKRIQKLEKSA